MSEENTEKVQMVEFEVKENFNDPKNQLHYGRGLWPLDKETAKRFQKEGRGKITSQTLQNEAFLEAKADAEKKEEDFQKLTAPGQGTDSTDEESEEETGEATELPENTPERELLISGGLDTIEKLKNASEEDILKIEGIGGVKATKIGLFLSELK
ncbi:MAG: hypothetical protein KG003_08140 [Bacteroidetes bacterium]|nr:hypothetical protein [Bacteroidota bacterium]